MKKLVALLLLSSALITSANAQIQKGNILAGADIANFSLGLNKGGNFSMDIDPKLGYFIQDNIAVGAFFNIGLSTAKEAGTNFTYGVGGLGRYYVNKDNLNLLKHGRWFAEGTVGVNGNNPANGKSTNGLGFSIGPGYAYFLTPNIGLETLLTYQGIVGFGSTPYNHTLELNIGFQIYLASAKAKEMMKDMK